MALVISDRIKETTNTVGTQTFQLEGAVTGFETFATNLSDGDTTYYAVTDNTNFEVGLGTINEGASQTINYTVTVVSDGGNKFALNGVTNPVITFVKGFTYVFDVSDNTNGSHPLRFRTSADASYTDGVSISGTQGQANATVTIVVASDAPSTLKYYCTSHGNAMGNTINVISAVATLARTTILASSNSNNAVSFGSGAKTIFCTLPAGKTVFLDGSGDLTLVGANGNIVFDKSDDALEFADNVKAKFGTSGDLEIYHDGSNSIVEDVGTGGLRLKTGNGGRIEFNNAEGDTLAKFDGNGNNELYHNNVKKIETTSDGATVTGTLVSDVISIADGSSTGDRLTIGTNNDFFIYHDTTPQTVIANVAGQGPIKIQGKFGEQSIIANQDGSVELYHNNEKNFETHVDGVTVGGDKGILQVNGTNASIGTTVAGVHLYSDAFRERGFSIFNKALGSSGLVEEFFMGVPYGDSAQPFVIKTNDQNETALKINQLGSVELYHNNVKKVETTSDGATVTGDLTTTADIELGHASDTTIARSSAGVVTIEGNTIITTGNSDTPTTTTSSSDADFVLVDDGGTMKKITPSNLGITAGAASLDDATALAIALG